MHFYLHLTPEAHFDNVLSSFDPITVKPENWLEIGDFAGKIE
jgi:hypothetical protein